MDTNPDKVTGSEPDEIIDLETDEKLEGIAEETYSIETLVEESKEDEKRIKKLHRKVKVRNVVMFIMSVIIIILLLRCFVRKDNPVINYIVDYVTDKEVTPDDKKKDKNPDSGRVDIPLITDFTVSKSASWINLGNPESNKGKYLLKFYFNVAGVDEPVYVSDMVESGKTFSVNFKELLDVGEYDATVVVNVYDSETFEEYNGANMKLKITVK